MTEKYSGVSMFRRASGDPEKIAKDAASECAKIWQAHKTWESKSKSSLKRRLSALLKALPEGYARETVESSISMLEGPSHTGNLFQDKLHWIWQDVRDIAEGSFVD